MLSRSRRTAAAVSICALAVLTCAHSVQAGHIYSFDGVTNNHAGNTAAGQDQLKLIVNSETASTVRFQFYNQGSEASSITDIYFDDHLDPLFADSINYIDDGGGTDFREIGKLSSLPGSGGMGWQTSERASSKRPKLTNGVNPGETLGLVMLLTGGKSFSDVIGAIGSSVLRVGVQVKGFANGGKESFVNRPSPDVPIVPEPTSLVLGCTACAGLFLMRRRRGRLTAAR